MTAPNIMVSGEINTLAGNQTNNVIPGNVTFTGTGTSDHLVATDIHLTATGNNDAIDISGGGKIRGDFSSSLTSVGASRSYFQSNADNSRTLIGAVPHGVPVSGSTSGYLSYGMNDTSTSSFVGIFSSPLTGFNFLQSGANTTGTVLPLRIYSANSGASGVTIYPTKDVTINGSSVATNATSGFLYIPTCAGVPTGVPTFYANTTALVIDSTNSKMYFFSYNLGAWVALN